MLGFSPLKILFTIAVVAVIWYGFKILSRKQAEQKKDSSSQTSQKTTNDADVQDLEACPACGNYIVKGKKCGCGDGI